ncbi:MAG: DUF2339 domain-containing protein [Vicinamibacterales bacterium]
MEAVGILFALIMAALPIAGLVMFFVMWARLVRARTDIERLSARLEALEAGRAAAVAAAFAPQTAAAERRQQPEPAPVERTPSPASVGREYRPTPVVAPPESPRLDHRREPTAFPEPDRTLSVLEPAISAIERFKGWLFGGNAVVRVGVIVLFFGVAFFFNYAIDRGWLPIEVRLMFAALGGLGLAGVGWRLRDTRRDYALVLQGGGIGIVYLTVFAAVNLYQLIGASPGLMLMVVVVALSSALAVLQDARSLAVLATLGGFLAPILVSRGGSHVALFSYYGVLDVGILAIAWFKAWRLLNHLGFLCTFVVGAAWGVLSYEPANFASTEPFLVAFFVFYVAIPVLFARRPDAGGTHVADGVLLFGVPLVAFALQAALVSDFEYGLAFSALGAGVFYVALASALWRRVPDGARLVVEAFLALGIGFGTIAIPLAVDGRWTASAWALEGAGLIWIGVRQRRQFPRVSGLVLQVTAGAAFLLESGMPARDVPVLNVLYFGALMVSLAGIFSGWYLHRHRSALERSEADASTGLLAWGLAWWCGAGLNEIATHVPAPIMNHDPAYLVFAAGTALLLTLLRRPLAWRHLSVPVLLLLPVMAFIALRSFTPGSHPLAWWWSVACGIALAAHYWTQWRLESEWPDRLGRRWHQGMLWLVVFLASWETAWLIDRVTAEASAWRDIAWAVVPLATIAAMPPLTRHVAWPFRLFAGPYMGALIPLVSFAAAWILVTSTARGNPAPLPYVLLANPLELAQGLALATLLQWSRHNRSVQFRRASWYLWSILAFAVLNGIIARATHVYGGVEFGLTPLWSSARYQTAVSIVWTTVALVAMLSATWLKQRTVWFTGAVVLTAVVAKLFLVDLDDVNTVARIVSFVGVGLLMLLVGYLSPLPPRAKEQEEPEPEPSAVSIR